MNYKNTFNEDIKWLEEIIDLKKAVDRHRPLDKTLENQVLQKLRLEWNYHTNAIEGNSFTHGETIVLLMEGNTAKGKPLKDALDIKGHNEAIDMMFSIIKNDRELNEADIRNLHKIMLVESYYSPAVTTEGLKTRKKINVGTYKTTPNHVETATGEIHYYAKPEETPAKMRELIEWYREVVKSEDLHPIVIASIFHHTFVSIHPFDDGNGRMARLLTNLILIRYGYPVIVIKKEDKSEYFSALALADNKEIETFVQFIGKKAKESLTLYLRVINGEEISEPEDLDKKISLFRQELNWKPQVKAARSDTVIIKITFDIFQFLWSKGLKFSDLFKQYTCTLQKAKNGGHTEITKVMTDFQSYKSSLQNYFINLSYVNFTLLLSRLVLTGGGSASISITLEFNPQNYVIEVGGNRYLRYYDEPSINEETRKLLETQVLNLMEKIRKANEGKT